MADLVDAIPVLATAAPSSPRAAFSRSATAEDPCGAGARMPGNRRPRENRSSWGIRLALRSLQSQQVVRGVQFAKTHLVDALADHVGEVLQDSRELDDRRFLTQLEHVKSEQ